MWQMKEMDGQTSTYNLMYYYRQLSEVEPIEYIAESESSEKDAIAQTIEEETRQEETVQA